MMSDDEDVPTECQEDILDNADIEMIPFDKASPDQFENDHNESILKSVKAELKRNKPKQSNRGYIICRSVSLTIALALIAIFTVFVRPVNPIFANDANAAGENIAVTAASVSDLPSTQEANIWDDWENSRELEEMIREKLKPKDFKLAVKDDESVAPAEGKNSKLPYMPSKQFAHLHHMKTGGTSMDEIISCSTSRLQQMSHQSLIKGRLSECSYGHFQECMKENNTRCANSIEKSAVMSYCAPLYSFQKFDWMDADIITVLRDPVDRVWSQYRFITKGCYKCTPLVDIYKMIDNNTINDFLCPEKKGEPCPSICVPQLLNHQSRNLILSYLDDQTESMDGQEKLEEAVENLKTKFTVIGITEELQTYREILGHAFPWLNETYKNSDRTCKLGHRNSSPSNNRCGERNTNWDLPNHPDEETRKAIIAHNQIDIKLFEAAKKYFAVQKRVFESL